MATHGHDHFCDECGEQLQAGAEFCAAHPKAMVVSAPARSDDGQEVDECIEADAKRLAKRALEGSDLSMGWRDAGYASALDAARAIVGAGGPEHQRAAEIVAESLRE